MATNDTTDRAMLNSIVTVYAKEVNGHYRLFNSTQYHKLKWDKINTGHITYYTHPEHQFNLQEAQKMEAFNTELAGKYGVEPIQFDYFVSNYSREILQAQGYDYHSRKYLAVQSGGLADIYNGVIYAGNNSEYYPHEVVHLYNHRVAPFQSHSWIDEGIATFLGGSTGYDLEWHIKKLRSFLDENPIFSFDSLEELNTDIPNGEHTTNFKYVIGGLICKRIFEKEGMKGLLDAIQFGRSDEEFESLLQIKLGIGIEGLEEFVRSECRNR